MLKPRKRVTRQQIKEDKLITFTSQASDYFNRNSRNIFVGGAIVAVLAIVVGFYFNSRAQAEKDATFELTLAKMEIGQGKYDTAIEKLTLIVDTYGGTRSAGDALFFLGNVRLLQENWAGARMAFQEFLSRYGRDPLLAAGAEAGIGFAEEHEERYQEAAEYFRRAATSYPNEFNAPQYLLDAGRCYALAGDTTQARNAFQLIMDYYQESTQSEKAKDELSRL